MTHEMAHNFGIYHDWDSRHGGKGNPCVPVGFMGANKQNKENRWSSCSVSDFKQHYTSADWGTWCLQDISGMAYFFITLSFLDQKK